MSSAPPPSTSRGLITDDPRVYLNKETDTWRYEEDDGTEMEFDTVKSVWVPLLDEDLVKRQQAAYAVAGVDEETPAAPVLARDKKKRKEPVDYTSATAETTTRIKRGKHDKEEDPNKPQKERKSKNTAVYVTGLPQDAEVDEIVQCFSKCGVLEEDDEGEPKVKMYAKDDGTFSGEALVVYFKEDSVLLALNVLDESELRLGDRMTTMHIAKADFAHKASGAAGSGGNSGEQKTRKVVDKKKASRRIVKMQKSKLQDWDDEDGFGPSRDPADDENAINKNSRVVVLKRMFTLAELDDDASLLLDLKEDVRDECSSLGEVTNVVLYDKEPEGVMTVKFRDPLSAHACVIKMNGRFFSGRKIEATLYAGKQRFQRSGAGDAVEGNSDEAEKKRLDDFAQWLLTEGD